MRAVLLGLVVIVVSACSGAADVPAYELVDSTGGQVLTVEVVMDPAALEGEVTDGQLEAVASEVVAQREGVTSATVVAWCGVRPAAGEAMAATAERFAVVTDGQVDREGSCP